MHSKQDGIVVPTKPKGIGIRHLQALLCFLGIATVIAVRTALPVGIVAMLDNSANPDFEALDWDEPTKGLILSSLYWGLVISIIPGGLLIHRVGGWTGYLIAGIGSTILSLLMPILAPLGWGYVFAIRLMLGLVQGILTPSTHNLVGKWIHRSERALASIVLAAIPFGTFLMMFVSGYITTSALGWPGIFYIAAALSGIWSVVWFFIGYDSPAQHRWISIEEQRYLQTNAGTTSELRLPLPWKSIFTSIPFLTLILANSSHHWGNYTLMNETPLYLRTSLNFDVKSSAIVASMPYLAMTLMGVVLSLLSDYLINNKYLSLIVSRKTFNTIGEWIPMVCMIGLGFITKDTANVGVAVLIISAAFSSGTNSGFGINHIDLAPNFSGPLAGFTNFAGFIFSILGPIFVGFVVSDPTNSSEWNILFFVTAGFYFIGNFVFLIFGKGTIQDWNAGRAQPNNKLVL